MDRWQIVLRKIDHVLSVAGVERFSLGIGQVERIEGFFFGIGEASQLGRHGALQIVATHNLAAPNHFGHLQLCRSRLDGRRACRQPPLQSGLHRRGHGRRIKRRIARNADPR